jgi:hypothetical protein
MTEKEWVACKDTARMLAFLQDNRGDCTWSPRKNQLFLLAVVHWPESILLPAEQKKLADLLRHIAGNPFRPSLAPPSWPAIVRQLVEALDHGEACSFALHDALLEAGHAELAELFRQEDWQPKRGWVVDLVIGEEPLSEGG